MSTTTTQDDEDLSLLHRCMRSEEDLCDHRRRTPWRGEYRFFRSANVVKLEDSRSLQEQMHIFERLRNRKRDAEKAMIARILEGSHE
jgi:hypothetical protein